MVHVYAVVITHKGTKVEYVEGIFINEDNAAEHAEIVADTLTDDYKVDIEPYPVKDWDEQVGDN